nr:hypothetical protein L203_03897 [Cryptococcus depauperatus CBS 7841]
MLLLLNLYAYRRKVGIDKFEKTIRSGIRITKLNGSPGVVGKPTTWVLAFIFERAIRSWIKEAEMEFPGSAMQIACVSLLKRPNRGYEGILEQRSESETGYPTTSSRYFLFFSLHIIDKAWMKRNFNANAESTILVDTPIAGKMNPRCFLLLV